MAPRTARRHELVGHTADVGLRAGAPDLDGVFEEAALALAEAAADVDAPASGRDGGDESAERVELEADDLAGLAYAWLNELIGLAQSRGQALAGTTVEAVEETDPGWRLSARARFTPYAEGGATGARARLDIKSATFHRLEVRSTRDGWHLVAYLDV